MDILLKRLLSVRFYDPDTFNPDTVFLKTVGISKRRWRQLKEGTSPIKGKEYAAIAKYFYISAREASESRQLYMFKEKL